MKTNDWEVKEYGIRPAGLPDECFYCHQKKGQQHKKGCVIRQRTVVVEVTIRMVRSIPEHWTPEDLEGHLNEGTSCADNLVVDIAEQRERLNKVDSCMCGLTHTKFIQEATSEDEQEFRLFVTSVPS